MDEIEKKIIDIIDKHKSEIINFAKDIYSHGELGYKEYNTSKKFIDFTKSLGLDIVDNLAITGAKAYLNKDKKENVSISLIGELDALKIPNHKYANIETKAAHCCGHHAQLAGVIGAAIALSNNEVKDNLDGQVIFFAVPAEEYGEIEYKNKLKAEGKIVYGGGKSELIRVGAFDDVDLSIVHHIGEDDISVGSGTNNGFVSKVIKYKGVASHAAGCPEKGVNALNAASIGLTSLSYQRETFKDNDSVRIHPIITKGGDLVNVVPDEVVVETLVRASNTEAIIDASKKTDRAFLAGAYAVGANCEITTMPGYLPTLKEEANKEVYEAAKLCKGDYNLVSVNTSNHSGGSTDVGDLEHIKPVLTFNTGGKVSGLHSVDFDIVDEELAYIVTAKIFALSTYRLLKNNAVSAKEIVNNYKPIFSKDEYIEYMNSMIKVETI